MMYGIYPQEAGNQDLMTGRCGPTPLLQHLGQGLYNLQRYITDQGLRGTGPVIAFLNGDWDQSAPTGQVA